MVYCNWQALETLSEVNAEPSCIIKITISRMPLKIFKKDGLTHELAGRE